MGKRPDEPFFSLGKYEFFKSETGGGFESLVCTLEDGIQIFMIDEESEASVPDANAIVAASIFVDGEPTTDSTFFHGYLWELSETKFDEALKEARNV